MKCLTCDAENKSDALYCRSCGSSINRCISCDALTENDARYCRTCGKATGALPERRAGEPIGHGEPRRADASNAVAKDEVDFTTKVSKVSPRRVEPIPKGPGRATRAMLYVAVVLVVAGVLASVAMTGINMRAMQKQVEGQAAERRAELAQMTKLIAETSDADRRAVYERLTQFVLQSLEEQRKSMMADFKQFVAQRLEEERRIQAQAQTQAQNEDYTNFVRMLARFKSKTRDRGLKYEIEQAIAMYNGKIAGKARQEKASQRSRRTPNRPPAPALAD
jgi:ribosomal protein L40E